MEPTPNPFPLPPTPPVTAWPSEQDDPMDFDGFDQALTEALRQRELEQNFSNLQLNR